MTDPKTLERLTAYLDDVLPVRDRAEVEALLSRDPEARDILKELKSLRKSLKDLPSSTPPDAFYDRVWRDIDAAPAPSRRRWAFPYKTLGALAALALVVVATKDFRPPPQPVRKRIVKTPFSFQKPSKTRLLESPRLVGKKNDVSIDSPATPSIQERLQSEDYSLQAAEETKEINGRGPISPQRGLRAGASAPTALSKSADTPSVPMDLPLFSQLRGQQSGSTTPLMTAIHSQKEWEDLWSRHNSDRPAPTFDFSRVMIVALFMGEKPTGGYNVQIKKVQTGGGHIRVLYDSTAPSPETSVTQALTSPFHLAVIPRVEGQVKFVSN